MRLTALMGVQAKLIADDKLHPVDDYEERRFAFFINLKTSGQVVSITDWRTEPKTPNAGGRMYQAPITDRTSGTEANLLYDNREYLFGIPAEIDEKGKSGEKLDKERAKKAARCLERLENFKSKIALIREKTQEGGHTFPEVEAVWNFYTAKDGRFFAEFLASEDFAEVIMKAPPSVWIAFRLDGLDYPAFNTPDLEPYLVPSSLGQPEKIGQCCITGETGLLGDNHTMIRGVIGANDTGAVLVSFNKKSFNSFGLRDVENAPMLRRVTRGYGRGLNSLLKDQDHHIRIGNGKHPGDGSIVIWGDDNLFTTIPATVVGSPLDLDANIAEQGIFAITDREESVRNYRYLRDRTTVHGEEPRAVQGNIYAVTFRANSARLAITDWYENSASTTYQNVVRWFDQMETVLPSPPRQWKTPMSRYVSILDFLEPMRALTSEDKARLKVSLFRSALTSEPIAPEVLTGVLRAFKASIQDTKGSFLLDLYQFRLAALVKLILTRTQGEQPVSVDPNNRRLAYNLGRLFALFERAQALAVSEIGTTILSRLSGAMESPAAEFPSLVKLNSKHLPQIDTGLRIWLERLIGEVFSNLGENANPYPFPQVLTDEEQGEFAMGYWQQKRALFTKSTTDETNPEETVHEAA
jgi:CRISPR-associated protein Csd1